MPRVCWLLCRYLTTLPSQKYLQSGERRYKPFVEALYLWRPIAKKAVPKTPRDLMMCSELRWRRHKARESVIWIFSGAVAFVLDDSHRDLFSILWMLPIILILSLRVPRVTRVLTHEPRDHRKVSIESGRVLHILDALDESAEAFLRCCTSIQLHIFIYI